MNREVYPSDDSSWLDQLDAPEYNSFTHGINLARQYEAMLNNTAQERGEPLQVSEVNSVINQLDADCGHSNAACTVIGYGLKRAFTGTLEDLVSNHNLSEHIDEVRDFIDNKPMISHGYFPDCDEATG